MKLVSTLLLVIGFLVSTAVYGGTVTLTASSDRCAQDVSGDFVADALGSDSDIYLRVFGWEGSSAGHFRCALEFPGIDADAQIVSATLYLYDGGTVGGGNVIEIHGYAGDGTVTLADFGVDNLVTSYTNTTGGVGRNLDLTAFVQSLGGGVAGFMLRRDTEHEGGLNGSDIDSTDNPDSENHPVLTIVYDTPTIPTLGPFGLLLLTMMIAAGALGMRRRRIIAN